MPVSEQFRTYVEGVRRRQIRAVLVSPNESVLDEVQAASDSLIDFKLIRVLDSYPASDHLLRLFRIHVPDLLLLDTCCFDAAVSLLAAIRAEAPNVIAIAVHHDSDETLLRATLRAGFDDFLTRPLRPETLRDCMDHCRGRLGVRPVTSNNTDLVFSFLPAKQGVGTTTIAVNAAVAAGAVDNTRTLLVDLDLSCGLVQFALKLGNRHSIIDAVRMTNDLDENLWPQMVTSLGALDVIHAGALDPQARLEPVQVRRFLDFTRRNYRVVCADLSGNLEDFSIEVMRESKRIFLVTTPELPALHLARARHRLLASLDLADRVALLLNRGGRNSLLTNNEIESVVGLPVVMQFPNDYKAAHEALSEGRALDRNTPLSRQIAAFANELLDRKAHQRPAITKRFIQYFTLVPARYQLAALNGPRVQRRLADAGRYIMAGTSTRFRKTDMKTRNSLSRRFFLGRAAGGAAL
ncbi:MAG TPA: hypothetical protein VFL57_20490, partial [Bryobacteraceae bacterium]|nr:hypothetical protein [Bryobacteraceae bacterium]